jgi:general nucleoside transport system permease protein
MDLETILQLAGSSLRLATPLLLACLAGLYSERAGIFDIGLEGKMLAAAFAAGAFAAVSGSAWVGLLAAIAASSALAALHGLASITLKGNQLISGVAINFLAAGLTVLIGQSWFAEGGRTPQLEGAERFLPIEWSFVEALAPVPVIGPVYQHLVSGHNVLVYAALLAVPLTAWVIYRTRFGLRLRAVGENPGAVDTAGVSVVRLRYAAVMIAGLLCGIAGAYLATGQAAGFGRDMTAGQGFIALAALIFAKWRPFPALWTCLLFGVFQAVAIRFPDLAPPEPWRTALVWGLRGLAAAAIVGLAVNWLRKGAFDDRTLGAAALAIGAAILCVFLWRGDFPSAFMQALPYILTVIILAGFVGKAVPPRAGGRPYVKER